MENLIGITTNELDACIYSAMKRVVTEMLEDGEKKSNPIFLSRKETASMLHISIPTLWAMGKKGILTPQRIGGKVLYDKGDVLNFLANGKH